MATNNNKTLTNSQYNNNLDTERFLSKSINLQVTKIKNTIEAIIPCCCRCSDVSKIWEFHDDLTHLSAAFREKSNVILYYDVQRCRLRLIKRHSPFKTTRTQMTLLLTIAHAVPTTCQSYFNTFVNSVCANFPSWLLAVNPLAHAHLLEGICRRVLSVDSAAGILIHEVCH